MIFSNLFVAIKLIVFGSTLVQSYSRLKLRDFGLKSLEINNETENMQHLLSSIEHVKSMSPLSYMAIDPLVNCVDLIPGLDRMSKGIDITTLDLFPSDIAQSAGFRQTIFEYTCSQQKKWSHPAFSDLTYSVPDQVQTISKAPAGSMNIRTRFNENIDELKESMGVKVDLEVSHTIGSFSASTSYKEAKNKLLQSNKSIAETSATISSIEVDFKSPMQLRLSPYFESSIDKLPARYEDNPEQYDLLINIFGTHYFEIAKFGGYLYQKTIIENNYLEQSRKEEISANLKLSFDGFFKLGVNMNAEYNQVTEESKKKFSSNTQKNFYNYGGTTKFSTDPDKNYIGKWWSTINKDPWLFGGQLRPIENLVRNATIKREVAKAALLKRIRSYLTDFQNSIKMTSVELNEESKKMLTEIDQYLNNNPSWDARDVLSHGKDIKKLFDRMRIYYDEIKMKAGNIDLYLNSQMYIIGLCKNIPDKVIMPEKVYQCGSSRFRISKKLIKPNQYTKDKNLICVYKNI